MIIDQLRVDYKQVKTIFSAMITKEKLKKEINRLSEVELEKVYLYLSSVTKSSTPETSIRSLKLKGKLDNKDIRSVAYE